VDGDDGGVIEDAGGLGLADEALLELLGLGVVGVGGGADGLEGDEAADQGVFGKLDDPHRTLTELTNDFVAAQFQLGWASGGGALAGLRGGFGGRNPMSRQ